MTVLMNDAGMLEEIDAAPPFEAFPKIARLNREYVITEKIDGTNAQVVVDDDGRVWAGSRKRRITVGDDNFGFAKWVVQHYEELQGLGPGTHYGEWWGGGIQRGYGLIEKRFSLFNVARWSEWRPACCDVVPVLTRNTKFMDYQAEVALNRLRVWGSLAAPGFMRPEGIVIFHSASNQLFKATLEGDEKPKGADLPANDA